MDKKYQDFIDAAGGIWAWMTASDGVVTREESLGFMRYLNTLSYADEISNESFEQAYTKILNLFEEDFEAGMSMAKSRIKILKSQHPESSELVRVARKALADDERVTDAEENILKEVSAMLGVDEPNFK